MSVRKNPARSPFGLGLTLAVATCFATAGIYVRGQHAHQHTGERSAASRPTQADANLAVPSMHHEAGHSPHEHAAPAADGHPFSRQMNIDMERMMTDMHAPGYTGNWDIDFLAMMIPHHQGAVDMAKLVLMHGRDPLTRTLAEEIIASQQAEIDAMSARLKLLRQREQGGAMQVEFPTLGGTRGSQQ